MTRISCGIILLAITVCACFSQTRTSSTKSTSIPDGDYQGLEPIESLSPEIPDVKSFQEYTLVVRNNEAILDRVPLDMLHGQKTYSASDGGFITYRGRFFSKDGKIFVLLRPFMSDYLAFPISCEPYARVETVPVNVDSTGVEMQGVRYEPVKLARQKQKDLLELLRKEPMEFNGQHPYWARKHVPPCQ